jgi:hypothetical protein
MRRAVSRCEFAVGGFCFWPDDAPEWKLRRRGSGGDGATVLSGRGRLPLLDEGVAQPTVL